MAVRLLYLRAHYRSPLEFSSELLDDSAAQLDRCAGSWSGRPGRRSAPTKR
ncbi:MAG: hypothetical protein KatS3mg011_0990 [Acidimicrobiia bacterium]|nr:MAG: hypothetical protein KatS3mg011_0990 [Acidimicrobiia bacterium]